MAVRRLPTAEHLPTALEVECHILIAKANASLHSSRRSAKRLLRKCGVACGAGDYIAVTIWSWTKSPGRFARFLQAGCATMAGSIPRSFRRNCAQLMPSLCDGQLVNTNGFKATQWRHGTGCVR